MKSIFQHLFIILSLALWLSGCAAIRTSEPETTSATLSPHPVKIYVAPFNIETAKWLVGRRDNELREFKLDFQAKFNEYLVERLQKVAPCESRWVNDLPDEGWLVAGEFKTVFQGSRAERVILGWGMGQTTFQTRVYVYDLSKSKTNYVMAFDTGVRDKDFPWQGAGSGALPGVTTTGIPIGIVAYTSSAETLGQALLPVGGPALLASAAVSMGTGLNLDGTRTAREIRNVLMRYAEPERYGHEIRHEYKHDNVPEGKKEM